MVFSKSSIIFTVLYQHDLILSFLTHRVYFLVLSSFYTQFMSNLERDQSLFAKKGFLYAALASWNDTPAEIRELPTLDHFKKQLKAHLKS